MLFKSSYNYAFESHYREKKHLKHYTCCQQPEFCSCSQCHIRTQLLVSDPPLLVGTRLAHHRGRQLASYSAAAPGSQLWLYPDTAARTAADDFYLPHKKLASCSQTTYITINNKQSLHLWVTESSLTRSTTFYKFQ